MTVPSLEPRVTNQSQLRLVGPSRAIIHAVLAGAGLQAIGTVLRLLNQIILAWLLGPVGLGLYALALSIAVVASIPAAAGLPQLLVRELAAADARDDAATMRGLLLFSNAFVLVSTVIVLAITGACFAAYLLFAETTLFPTFLLGLFLVPVHSLSALRTASLFALRRFIAGQWIESIAQPAFMLCFLLSFHLWIPEQTKDPNLALALYIASTGAALAIGSFILGRALPASFHAVTPIYRRREWIRGIIPLSLNASSSTLNDAVGILLLGALATPAAVGIFRIAQSGVQVATFGNRVLLAIIRPEVSRLWGTGDRARLAGLLALAARAALIPAAIALAAFAAAGEQIIDLVCGSEFVGAAKPMVILTAGAVVVSGFGFSATLLEMTAYASTLTRVLLVFSAANIILNAVLIFFLGISGAAIAGFLHLAIRQLALHFTAGRMTGIYATAFSKTPLRFGNRKD